MPRLTPTHTFSAHLYGPSSNNQAHQRVPSSIVLYKFYDMPCSWQAKSNRAENAASRLDERRAGVTPHKGRTLRIIQQPTPLRRPLVPLALQLLARGASNTMQPGLLYTRNMPTQESTIMGKHVGVPQERPPQ